MKIEHKYSFKDKDFEKFMKKNNFEEINLPTNYTWEKEGKNIINNLDNIILFSNEQKKIIKYLYLNDLIPKQYHSELWYISIGAKREQINNPNYYKNLLNNYPYFIPSAHEKQIELDIPRTFVDPNLQNCSDLKIKLRNILIAYSKRNITIGYCQGFNFMVGKLLQYYNYNEEKTFWVFTQILENILPLNYFITMYGVLIDTNIIMDILKMKNGDDLNTNLELFYYKTIILFLASLFTENLNDKLLYLVYDSLFMDGFIVIYKVILFLFDYLMKMHKKIKRELELNEMDEYYNHILNNINEKDLKNFKKLLFDENTFFEFNIKSLEKMRYNKKDEIYREIEKDVKLKKFKEDEKENKLVLNSLLLYKNGKKNDFKECDLDWPLCIYDKKYRYELCEFLNFRVLNFDIKEDYFNNISELKNNNNNIVNEENNKNINPLIKQAEKFKDLLIERRKHLCDSNEHFSIKIKEDNLKENIQYFYKKAGLFNENNKEYNNNVINSIDDANRVFKSIMILKKEDNSEKSKINYNKKDLNNFLNNLFKNKENINEVNEEDDENDENVVESIYFKNNN